MMTSAIVLAAGRSERMGQPKLLLPFGHTTVIGSVIEALLDAGVDELVAVLRAEDSALRIALEGRPVRIVENPDREGRCWVSAVRAASAVGPG